MSADSAEYAGSRDAKEPSFIWRNNDGVATLIFPRQPFSPFAIASRLLFIASFVSLAIYYTGHSGYEAAILPMLCAVAWAIRFAERVLCRPGTVQISDGWLHAQTPLGAWLGDRHRTLARFLSLRIDAELSEIAKVKAVDTSSVPYTAATGCLVIADSAGVHVSVGLGSDCAELELAAGRLRRAMLDAGWRPPVSHVASFARELGRGVRWFTHV